MPDFTYDLASRRYRSVETGRYLSGKEVRQAVDVVIDNSEVGIKAQAARLVAGEISLAEWQTGMSAQLKGLHLATGLAANGGFNNTSQSDFGFIGSRIKKQYEYLNQFAADVASGKQPLDGTLAQRAGLYVQAGRDTFHETERRINRNGGVDEAKRILGAADHCPGCLSEASRGWVSIDDAAAIGSKQCLSRCRCSLIYRKSTE